MRKDEINKKWNGGADPVTVGAVTVFRDDGGDLNVEVSNPHGVLTPARLPEAVPKKVLAKGRAGPYGFFFKREP